MSSNFDMLKKIGREKFTFLDEYADKRIESHRSHLESATDMEAVRKHQGAIDEMRYFKSALESYRNK
jgi:hypothetical protein